MEGKVIVLYGPSCSGKSSIQKALKDIYKPITTATTRKPREGEVNGIHYYFMTEEEFMNNDKNGLLLEKNNYLGNWYGVPLSSVENTIYNGETRTVVLDINGVKVIKEKYPKNCVTVYIGANKESLMRRFLNERNSNEEEIMSRISKAIKEELTSAYTDYADVIVWNNDGANFKRIVQEVLKNV